MDAVFGSLALPAGVSGESMRDAPAPPVGGGLVAEDERGRLYVMGADGLLRVTDARTALVAVSGGADAGAEPPTVRVFAPTPPLPFVPTLLEISPSGQHAAVAGVYTPPGAGVPHAALAVLRLSAAAAGALSAPRPGDPPAEVPVLGAGEARHACALPAGVALRRMTWHPASEAHLCCLLSDATLRLYAVPPPGPTLPGSPPPRLAREQELALCPDAPPPPGALRPAAPATSPAVDFAFWPHGGPRRSWAALAMLLLFRDGSLRLLCPAPTPFGGHLPSATVAVMAAESRSDADAQAWLAAALPLTRPDAPSSPVNLTPAAAAGRAAAAAAAAAMVRVAPHCLPGSAPALQGPLQGGGGELGGSGAVALALAAVPGAADATLVCVAGGDATLRVSLLLGPPRPAFAHAPASMDRDRVRAAACPVVGAPPALLAMDHILPSATSAAADSGAAAARWRSLTCALAWETPPGQRLFCAAGGRACVVTLTWLPAVQRLLADDGGGGGSAAAAAGGDVPLPTVEALREGGGALAAAALLCGADGTPVLLTVDAAGAADALSPAPVAPPPLAPPTPPPLPSPSPPRGGAFSGGEEAERADAELEALAAGPPAGAAPALPADAALRRLPGDVVAAQAALAAAAGALRERYVTWAHRCHAELGRRGARLGREGARQATALAALSAAAEDVRRRGAALAERAARADALHANMRARAALLAELGRGAPALRDAEAGAGAAALAAELRGWREALPGMGGRLAELRSRADAAAEQEQVLRHAGHAQGPYAAAVPELPPSELARLKAALEASTQALQASVQRVRALTAALEGDA